MENHLSSELSSNDYPSGHIQIQLNLFDVTYPSELNGWFSLLDDNFFDAFKQSLFPANMTNSEFILFLKIQLNFKFYDNQSNIVETGGNGYIVATIGSLWNELINLGQCDPENLPDYFFLTHTLVPGENPDFGQGFNHSFIDPFTIQQQARDIYLNQTNTEVISLGTYKDMLVFQNKWDLPTFPGYLLLTTPSFFQYLFSGEELIHPSDTSLNVYIEWRGWFQQIYFNLKNVEYTLYFDRFTSLIQDIVGINLRTIISPSIENYSSRKSTLNTFIYSLSSLIIPLLFVGIFILFRGMQILFVEKKTISVWLNEKGYDFPSHFLHNVLQK